MTTKLDQVIQAARELKNAVAEQQAIWAAIEKKYSDKPSTTATNATAPAPAGGRQFVSNDILANYERV